MDHPSAGATHCSGWLQKRQRRWGRLLAPVAALPCPVNVLVPFVRCDERTRCGDDDQRGAYHQNVPASGRSSGRPSSQADPSPERVPGWCALYRPLCDRVHPDRRVGGWGVTKRLGRSASTMWARALTLGRRTSRGRAAPAACSTGSGVRRRPRTRTGSRLGGCSRAARCRRLGACPGRAARPR